MYALGCLLGLFLGIILLFLNVGLRLWLNVRQVLRQFSGQQKQQDTRSRFSSSSEKQQQKAPSSKKVFADNEGEYVDFEEVKE